MDAGSAWLSAVRSGSPVQVWHWLNAQTYYPFVTPVLHGLALLVTDSVLAAAWLPAFAAYALTGLVVGRLARALGAGRPGAWMAAVLFWSTPIDIRLAAGAFTEDFGACVVVLLLLALARLDRRRCTVDALLVGAVIALAALVKYDYGILALGVAGVAGLRALVVRRSGRTVWLYGVAGFSGACPVGLLLLSFLYNSPDKLTNVTTFIFQPGIRRHVDFGYYPKAIFANGEIGLATGVAVLLVSAPLWCVWASRRRPELLTPVLAVGVWLVIYSSAAAKQARIAVPIMPVLAVLAALAVTDLAARVIGVVRSTRLGSIPVWALAAAGAVLIGVPFLAQVKTMGRPLWFVRENPPASQALAFVSRYLPVSSDRPLLVIGASNALSPHSIELTWTRRLGHQAPQVITVPEAPGVQRRDALLDAIRRSGPSRIVAIDMAAGSRLVDLSASGGELFPSQHDYATIASMLGGPERVLIPVASLSLESDPLHIDVWDVEPSALAGILRVVTVPALPATISVDGTARDGFGVAIGLPIGTHDVCFGAVAGFRAPGCQGIAVTAGATTTVTGSYLPEPGAPGDGAGGGVLSVVTVPAVDSQILVDGIPRDTARVNRLGLAPGVHRVCFGYVAGFYTPACRAVTIADGTATSAVVDFSPTRFVVKRG